MRRTKSNYPIQFTVDYPKKLSRLSTFFRIILTIPIFILYYLLIYVNSLVLLPTLLMILFKRKYPKWWFDWNVALLKFANRICVYFSLLRDEYPSTDEDQTIHLKIPYPNVKKDLNRWLPLVKWILVIPHYIILTILSIVSLFVIIIAFFSILITGTYPRSLFNFVVGVMRWSNRVMGYACLLVTDRYPPFGLSE